jgi:glycosyltransferase involved in cell wall biosynthesis
MGPFRVSVITPAYNAAHTIEDTIISVQNQTYPNVEHIIVDGGSKDHTRLVVEPYLSQLGGFISEPDRGLYDAINKGIAMATGEVIAILNADDFYAHNYALEEAMHYFNRGAQATYADLEYVSQYDKYNVLRKWHAGDFRFRYFLRGWMPPHPTFLLRRDLYEQYGGYDLSLKSAADYELMLRFLFKLKIGAVYIPHVMVRMRDGGMSNSSLKNRMRAHREDKRAWRMNRLRPHPHTLVMKPLRKVRQFRVLKYLYEGWIKTTPPRPLRQPATKALTITHHE